MLGPTIFQGFVLVREKSVGVSGFGWVNVMKESEIRILFPHKLFDFFGVLIYDIAKVFIRSI